MKHSYRTECTCRRCTKERERRTQQSGIDTARNTSIISERRKSRRPKRERRPEYGSQEWAETYRDDLPSESGDY